MILIAVVAWVNAAAPAAVPPRWAGDARPVGGTAPAALPAERPSALASRLRSGDLVLQASQSGMAESIRRATRSPYSHVGLVEVADDGVWVLEAISPVSRTRFETWRRRGRGGQLTVLRPLLSPGQAAAAVQAARAELGKPYDVRYRWDDERLYCSKLVVKAFERAAGVTYGQRVRLDALELGPREKARAQRLGVPLSQEVVPPGSLAADPRLELVFSDVAAAGAP